MTSRHSDLPRVQCAFIRIKPENKQIGLEGRINSQVDKIVLFTYFESSSYSLCTKSGWFKAVLRYYDTANMLIYSNKAGRPNM